MIPHPETLIAKLADAGITICTAENGVKIPFVMLPPEFRDELVESLLSALPQRGWQDIATAPKDGTQVLVIVAGGKRIVASWNIQFDDWQEDALSYAFVPIEPLLWHPLPDLPAPPVDTEPT